jgi:predicted dinucleotide-binding enzyme
MKIGVLGTGQVGQLLGSSLVGLGYEVMMGSRDPYSQKVIDWVAHAAGGSSAGTLAETAAFGQIIVLATQWAGTANALELAGIANFAGKIVIDVTNPLKDGPNGPELAIGFNDSAGETVQRRLPEAKVVKAWNHVPAPLMVSPHLLGETADMFICGNDKAAKQKVSVIMRAFGCPVIDLGGIEQARLTEALTGLWIRYMTISGNWQHAFKLIRKD